MRAKKMPRYARSEWILAGAPGLGAVVLTLVLLGAPASARKPASAGMPALARLGQARPAAASLARSAVEPGSEGWKTVFSETFESGIGADWTVDGTGEAADEGAIWGTSTYTYVKGGQSAWCAGGAVEPSDLYTDGMDTWLVSAPIELGRPDGAVWEAEAHFAWWLDADSGAATAREALGTPSVQQVTSPPSWGDWFGWAVLTDAEDLGSGRWTYFSDATGRWVRTVIPLDDYLPSTEGTTTTVYLAFHFVSDDDGAVGRGAFVDDVVVRANFGHEVALPLVIKEPPPTPTPTPIPTSLLENPSFEEGWYDIAPNRQVPNHWSWQWVEDEIEVDGASVDPGAPETNVKLIWQVPDFILDGTQCVKAFTSHEPIYAALSQDVSGLEVGREYRLVAPIYIDVFDWHGGKVPPTDPWAARVRLGVSGVGASWPDDQAVSYGRWWDGGNTDDFYLSYHDVALDFTATETEMTVYVEVFGKWGLDNNGFFMDDFHLFVLP